MRLSRYLKTYPSPEKPGHLLLFSTKTAALALVSEATFTGAEQSTLDSSTRETLARLGFLVPDSDAEREEMRRYFATFNRNRDRGSVIAVLNLDCNLACTYCFEGGMKGKHYMSTETEDLMVDFLERHYLGRGKALCLDFYGGEPLLSMDMIRSVATRLQKIAKRKGVPCSFGMVTNGTLLTGAVARELAHLGVNGVQVTIDGPQDNHDRFRPFVSGSGSFDAIIGNVRDACELLEISIVGNYTKENYREFPRLLDYFVETGLSPAKLRMVGFAVISKSGGDYLPPEYKDGCASHDEPWIIEAGLFLREEILRRGFATPKVQQTLCSVELDDDLIITHDGRFYKCPAMMGWKELAVGDLVSGICEFRDSHGLDNWKKDECLDCEYLPLCFGGCRWMQVQRHGDITNVNCRKDFYDATLGAYLQQDMMHRSRVI